MSYEQQAPRPMGAEGSPDPPSRGGGMRWAVVGLAILLAGALAALVVVLVTGGAGDDAEQQALDISASVERPLERLDDAAQEASPANEASMVALAAAADRAVEELDDADAEIRALDAEAQRDAAVQELEDGIDASRDLAEALADPRLSAEQVQGLTEDTQAALDDLATVDLPEVSTNQLVAALRRQQRQRAERRRTESTPEPAESSETTPAPPTSLAPPSYRPHTVWGRYQTQIPTGPGWGEPVDSQPTPGQLFRTSVRGPAEMFVLIDHTPLEPAEFGGRYESRRDIGQTAFGSATEYVFQGGNLPECQPSRCVDYIINDTASDSGFAVLAGGSDFAVAHDIARTAAESLVPHRGGE